METETGFCFQLTTDSLSLFGINLLSMYNLWCVYHIWVYLGQQGNHKLFHWCFIPACWRCPVLLCNLDVSSEACSSVGVDNLMGDIALRPDPPGSSEFVLWYIDPNFDGAGTILTMTNPPPNHNLPRRNTMCHAIRPPILWLIPHLFNLPRRNTVTVYHALWPPIHPHEPTTTTSKTPSMTMMLLPF